MSTIFISYSRADEKWRALFAKHLGVLGAEFDVWDDQRIASGADWNREISEALERASVAVLLISADFLTSRFIADFELPVIVEAERSRGLFPYPVVVRPCMWEQSPIARLNIRHTYKEGGELSLLTEGAVEQALTKIGREIAGHLSRVRTPAGERPPVPSGPVKPADAVANILDKGAAVIEAARGIAGTAGASGKALGDEVAQLEARLAALSEHGRRLARGKRLHDELHGIEFQCLGRLTAEARRLPDATAREQLDYYLKDLDGAVLRLRDAANGASVLPWIEGLAGAVRELGAALNVPAPEPAKVLGAAAVVERDTSRQLTTVNGEMLRALKDFDFTPLQAGVESLARLLAETDPSMHGELQEPLLEFRRLRDELTSLTEEHDDWQRLYDELRGHAPAPVPTDDWRQEIELYWPDLEEDISVLCSARKDALRSRLQKESAGFGQRLASGDTTTKSAAEAFAMLRQMFARGFFKVDDDLKKTFDHLVRRTAAFRISSPAA